MPNLETKLRRLIQMSPKYAAIVIGKIENASVQKDFLDVGTFHPVRFLTSARISEERSVACGFFNYQHLPQMCY